MKQKRFIFSTNWFIYSFGDWCRLYWFSRL